MWFKFRQTNIIIYTTTHNFRQQGQRSIEDVYYFIISVFLFRKSVDLCQQIEATGVSFITVHGRTTFQKNEPIDQECIKLINESVNIPVILNGDIKNLSDAITMQEYTGCKGIKIILIWLLIVI